MKKITNKRTGETFDGELWLAEIKDGKRYLKIKIEDEKDLDDIEIEDEEELPFEEVAEIGFVVAMTAEKTIEDRHGRVDKIEIADRDYYEILPDGTKKTRFTWDEAMEIEKKTHGKWRVPTVPEWFAICAAFGRSEDGTDVDPQVLKKNLNLATDEDGYGNYWSAATYGTSSSRYLYFNASNLNPRGGDTKGYGFAVRCVASSV